MTFVLSKRANIPPSQMLAVIANAHGMDVADYGNRSRRNQYVYLRATAAFLLKKNYPHLSDQSIADLFEGGHDRSTIVNSRQNAELMLQTKQEDFTFLFNHSLKLLDLCLESRLLERR